MPSAPSHARTHRDALTRAAGATPALPKRADLDLDIGAPDLGHRRAAAPEAGA